MDGVYTLADIDGTVFFGGAVLIAVIWITLHYASGMVKGRQREETKRELGAYVAEGSISVDDAERILAAGSAADLKSELAHRIADQELSVEDAERILRAGSDAPAQPA